MNYARMPKPPVYLAVHCADTFAAEDIGVKEIRNWHIHERGFIDVGYHLVIRRDGRVEVGRPLWAIGAHVEGYNSRSLGVCLVGGKGKLGWENNFTPAQLAALTRVLAEWTRRWPAAVVQGHRDFPGVQKRCPSFDVRAWWAGVKVAGHT